MLCLAYPVIIFEKIHHLDCVTYVDKTKSMVINEKKNSAISAEPEPRRQGSRKQTSCT